MQNRSLFPYLQGGNLSTGIKEEILPRIFQFMPLADQGTSVCIQYLIWKMLFLNPALWAVFGIVLP